MEFNSSDVFWTFVWNNQIWRIKHSYEIRNIACTTYFVLLLQDTNQSFYNFFVMMLQDYKHSYHNFFCYVVAGL
jgi:hypothetical protein